MPSAFGPTFSHHLHKTILHLLYQMHNHFQIAVLGLLSPDSLVRLVAVPGVVGLVALEGLLGFSFPFLPLYHNGISVKARCCQELVLSSLYSASLAGRENSMARSLGFRV